MSKLFAHDLSGHVLDLTGSKLVVGVFIIIDDNWLNSRMVDVDGVLSVVSLVA